MKALLVDIDLLVRIIVPDDATDAQIWQAAATKAGNLIEQDPDWLCENIGEIREDTEMPYDPNNETIDGKVLIGYQIESTDGKHNIPEGLYSFEVFPSKEAVEKWSDEHQLDGNWKVVPVYDGDIEGVTYVDEDIVE